MPTWPRPWKRTGWPGWSSDRETATPAAYWVETVRGIDTPTCEYTYIVKPEQSKPVLGDDPPHRYGVPRYCIAIPTTPPPYFDGGAPVGEPVEGWDSAGADATRASAAASIRAWRRRSAAWIAAISSLIESSSCCRCARLAWISDLRAARSATTCSWRFCAFSSWFWRSLISVR